MVELKKDLPEIFEEFADQRRNSFLAIKKLKEQGVPVVGAFCTYLPKELPRAMGAAVVGLCSVSDETIPDAEKDLPRNLCPLIKSSYGFAKTDKCPFFYFSDLVVGETTCDGKKKMYEMLADFKPVYVIELPNRQSEEGIAMYRREIIRFKEELERRFETTITEEAIRAIKAKYPDFYVITDVCMCEYTDHGHCGILLSPMRCLLSRMSTWTWSPCPPASTIWRTRSRRSTPPARTRARSPVSW